ncbi:MAG: YraN family protein [Acidimicrobiia bacterium]|nr:YraN family protein [Acidimicrobiia bacterium]NNF88084.1 YraN family protein [Acidimicrobiia bacterium]NNJ46734.1 YraN family protein [Acidimicrobiia bacterium]
MGYVSTGSVPEERPDHELPGREHRRARARDRALANRRLAAWGESLAATFLEERGAVVLGRNVRAGRGEIDLLVRLDSTLVAVEVKTRAGGDPRQAYTAEKARKVDETAGRLTPSPGRVDLIAVAVGRAGVDIRWIPGV